MVNELEKKIGKVASKSSKSEISHNAWALGFIVGACCCFAIASFAGPLFGVGYGVGIGIAGGVCAIVGSTLTLCRNNYSSTKKEAYHAKNQMYNIRRKLEVI